VVANEEKQIGDGDLKGTHYERAALAAMAEADVTKADFFILRDGGSWDYDRTLTARGKP
jgi:hypothetical protein